MSKEYTIRFVLLVQKNKYLRYDILPFYFLYAIVLYWWYDSPEDDDVYPRLAFIGTTFLHCITYLLGHWSQRMKGFLQFNSFGSDKSDNAISKATYVLIQMEQKNVRQINEIVQLKYDIEKQIFFINFTENKYIFDENKREFYRLKPHIKNRHIDEFVKGEHRQDTTYFDRNSLEIPIKKFRDIFKDQIMEPFSFFQMFSVSLWLMDESRFYALLTLFMLVLSAFTVVIQRMRTMLMLRQMKLHPQYINAYRNKRWIKINSEDLSPGDIVQIQTNEQIKPVQNDNQVSDEQYLREQVPFSHLFPQKLFKSNESSNSFSYKTLPCDLLLLSGNCVVNESVLTGESIPQIKDSIENYPHQEILDLKLKHKTSLLFCGTEVIQCFPTETYPEHIRVKPEKPSCLAYVLRTGFDTSKGKLIRTVLHNNENIQIKQKDAFALIGILLIFSIISSAYVLFHGLEDGDRNKNKLFIRCILIITTVVPPELPMILTIAVNTSLLYLQRKKIFCTEPYRIPYGGKITMCAFDKTGTLTSDQLKFVGILDQLDNIKILKQQYSESNINAQCVLAGCHSLLQTDKQLQGDPIEILFFDKGDWKYDSGSKTSKKKGGTQCRILQMFPFRSDLKRMSTLVHWEPDNGQKEYRVLCKGAPEIIEGLLKKIPPNYKSAYEFYSKQGYRVLALAYNPLEGNINFQEIQREEIEKELIFVGFFICDSPLKYDTQQYIKVLQNAQYQILMITGDNLLTAVSVASKLNLGKSQQYLYLDTQDGVTFYWRDEDNKEVSNSIKKIDIQKLSQQYLLCLTGNIIEKIIKKIPIDNQKVLYKYVQIYARTSPAQKEHIIFTLRQFGEHLLMCGDGTNDVGALKKADIGIALVGLKDEQTQEQKRLEKEKKRKEQEELKKDFRKYMQHMQQQKLKEQQETNLLSGADQIEYKAGDACIAAPFTNKHSNSIRCVIMLLRQGICTLVTTIQTYKILALSSIIQAYSLSVLHMEALKLSETQQTILGITAAIAYYQFSNSRPLKKLSPVKPVSTIFEWYFIVSVIGQCSLHLYGMQKSFDIGIQYSTPDELKITHDQEFKPTFLGTCVFLYQLLSQTCIFLFNNGGEPHMEGFSKHPKFFKMLIVCLIGCFVFSLNIMPDISTYFELKFTDVNSQANEELFKLFSIISICNYCLEMSLRYMKLGKLYGYI
ncbi:hypothetical protein IMG5_160550 [Ichthyophthirius multifiliis]|uniref:Cation-transporting ATPase n=1 Tax=Ichthyophthirius multifiliis TaxID=5932 RepID=G0QZY5_ICHMU|nr:hypothetical protein IMG5_160550 [Ichthyophthirius multifiliis]EGR29218.1 hypothetical protein IMG5_160550 [Ichthyophthirius multifiliis]|eukprot:XP_004030454.1 hypothetical protein IMG5_160550 [Ichthyophthirius multifiliis]